MKAMKNYFGRRLLATTFIKLIWHKVILTPKYLQYFRFNSFYLILNDSTLCIFTAVQIKRTFVWELFIETDSQMTD